MHHFSSSPIEMFASLWRNRGLIKSSVRREVLGRYRGSALGLLWSLFNPLLMLAVYTFIFSEVFKARWSVGSESKTEFALVLFSGLIIFNIFSDCFNRAPVLILSNPNYVKKVVFPLEVLPFVCLLTALYHALISLGIWLAAYTLFFGAPHATALYLPMIIAPYCFLIMGASWMLASLGVFLRDVSQIVAVLTSVLMFISPIFYPATALPESYQYLLYINPLTSFIEQSRDVLFWGRQPSFVSLGILWAVTLAFAWLGFAWFQKTRKGFADVM